MSLIASVLLVPLDPALADRLQAHCAATGRPIDLVVREAVALRLTLAGVPADPSPARGAASPTSPRVRAWRVERGGRDAPR
jgi:hypothetical protein